MPVTRASTATCPLAIEQALSGLSDREAVEYLREVVADLVGQRETAADRWRRAYPELNRSEARICALLQQRISQVVAWDSILAALLADRHDAVTSRKTIDVHLCRIRRKAPGVVIDTVRGSGLCMRDAGLAVQP